MSLTKIMGAKSKDCFKLWFPELLFRLHYNGTMYFSQETETPRCVHWFWLKMSSLYEVPGTPVMDSFLQHVFAWWPHASCNWKEKRTACKLAVRTHTHIYNIDMYVCTHMMLGLSINILSVESLQASSKNLFRETWNSRLDRWITLDGLVANDVFFHHYHYNNGISSNNH